MATLVGNVNSSATDWTVSASIPHGTEYLSVDSETVQVLAHFPASTDPQTRLAIAPRIRVQRAAGGTSAASHTSGATLTPVVPPAGIGVGVTIDNGDVPPAGIATILARGAGIDGDICDLSHLQAASDVAGTGGELALGSAGSGDDAGAAELRGGNGLADKNGGTARIQGGSGDAGAGSPAFAIFEGGGLDGITVGRIEMSGSEIALTAGAIGFFDTGAVAKPSGVAVTAEAIHAALVSLGLIEGP